MNAIFTIGYGNRELRVFLELLQRYDIGLICDVRSIPYSKRHGDFNREALQLTLERLSVKYAYFGAQLGARPADSRMYVDGRASYGLMAGSAAFCEGIERIRAMTEFYRIALMCAEKDPFDCHRAILIGRVLASKGAFVQHIAAEGNVEPQEHLERRLLAKYKFTQRSLFEPPSESAILAEAYRRRGLDLGYDVDTANRAQTSS